MQRAVPGSTFCKDSSAHLGFWNGSILIEPFVISPFHILKLNKWIIALPIPQSLNSIRNVHIINGGSWQNFTGYFGFVYTQKGGEESSHETYMNMTHLFIHFQGHFSSRIRISIEIAEISAAYGVDGHTPSLVTTCSSCTHLLLNLTLDSESAHMI